MGYKPIDGKELKELVEQRILEYYDEYNKELSPLQMIDLTLNEFSKALTYSKSTKVIVLSSCLFYILNENEKAVYTNYSDLAKKASDSKELISINNVFLKNIKNIYNDNNYTVRLSNLFVYKFNDLIRKNPSSFKDTVNLIFDIHSNS